MKKEENLILAGLSFDKMKIANACDGAKSTKLAVSLIAFSVLFDTLIAFFNGNSGSSGFARMGLSGVQAAVAEMGSAIIGTFLGALIMVYVIRIYKVSPSYTELLKLYGAAIIWTILGSLVALLSGFGMIGAFFWLAFNFSLLFGMTGYTKIKIWQSFLSIVLTFVVVFLMTILYGLFVGIFWG